MSKKNIILLAAGYVAGGIVASLFNKKKPTEIKKELKNSKESGEGEFSVFVDNFLETHKNLITTVKKEILTEKNKKFLESKKQDVLDVIESYQAEWESLLRELKGKGKTFLVETSDNLEKLYNEKKSEIEGLSDITPEKISELKDKLKGAYSELKDEITQKTQETPAVKTGNSRVKKMK